MAANVVISPRTLKLEGAGGLFVLKAFYFIAQFTLGYIGRGPTSSSNFKSAIN